MDGAAGPDAGIGQLAAVLTAAGVSWDQVTGYSRLGGGTFNAVYLVRRAGGTGLVVKLAPDPAGPMLRYERGILSTEAMYYRLAGQPDGVAVPSLAAVDAGRGVVAGGYLVPLPRPAPQIRELLAAQAPVLDQVQNPVLVHFDLWDGNILVDMSQGAPRIGALIDAERAFWGDPLAEFVSLALFAGIEQDPAFLHGYRKAGGTVTFDAAARLRLSLYRAYLYLIMWVEAAPRKSDAARLDQLRHLVLRPLARTLDEWSARR